MDPASSALTVLLAVILFTSFVKVFTSLSILSFGLGIQGAGMSLILAAVSFVLSLAVTQPYLGTGGGAGSLLGGTGSGAKEIEQQLAPFMTRNTDGKVRERLGKLIASGSPAAAAASEGAAQPQPSNIDLAAFLISQLRDAFTIGLMLLVPFFVIDVLIAQILALLNLTQISAAVVALPAKLLLFVAVDGWTLVAEKLIGGYVP